MTDQSKKQELLQRLDRITAPVKQGNQEPESYRFYYQLPAVTDTENRVIEEAKKVELITLKAGMRPYSDQMGFHFKKLLDEKIPMINKCPKFLCLRQEKEKYATVAKIRNEWVAVFVHPDFPEKENAGEPQEAISARVVKEQNELKKSSSLLSFLTDKFGA